MKYLLAGGTIIAILITFFIWCVVITGKDDWMDDQEYPKPWEDDPK